jgi:hypothetical protein
MHSNCFTSLLVSVTNGLNYAAAPRVPKSVSQATNCNSSTAQLDFRARGDRRPAGRSSANDSARGNNQPAKSV